MIRKEKEKKSGYELTCDYYVRIAKRNIAMGNNIPIETVDKAFRKSKQYNTVNAYRVLGIGGR